MSRGCRDLDETETLDLDMISYMRFAFTYLTLFPLETLTHPGVYPVERKSPNNRTIENIMACCLASSHSLKLQIIEPKHLKDTQSHLCVVTAITTELK